MSIVLYHHPFSRAANVVWMLEELGQPYELKFVDIMKGGQKAPDVVKLNPMGKLPLLTDGDQVVTESNAIGMYLADRYSYGKLAPKVEDPKRGTYLRWSCFAPSVIEPGLSAKQGNWECKPSQVGWGTHAEMLTAIESALEGRQFLLGDEFSMADCIFGGTVRFMLMFKALEERPSFKAYADRLAARPAAKRADEKNQAIMKEHNIKFPGT